jgi:hypothetical protein
MSKKSFYSVKKKILARSFHRWVTFFISFKNENFLEKLKKLSTLVVVAAVVETIVNSSTDNAVEGYRND